MTQDSEGIPFRAYFTIVLRWKWLVVALFLLGALGAALYCFLTTPQYAATAELIYQPQIDISNPLQQQFVDRTERQAVLETVPAVVAGPAIAERADRDLTQAARQTPHSVSVELQVGVEDTYSNVVRLTAISPDSTVAADVANAYASAFIEWRREQAQYQVTRAIDAIREKLAALDTLTGRTGVEYETLQQRLSDLQILKATVTGSFTVISPAGVPSSPFSPDWVRMLLFGGLGGLILGLIGAFVLAQFDTRLRSEEEIVREMPAPVLGRVPRLNVRTADGDPMPTLSTPGSTASEAYRVLRSNLEFVFFEGDVRRIMLTSSLQSEGKSLAACNLAVSMALAGKRVILVDCDLRNPSLHGYLGLPNAVGLSSVIARGATLGNSVLAVDLLPGAGADGGPSSAGTPTATRHAVVHGTVGRLGDGALDFTPSAGFAARLCVLPSGPIPPNPGELVASSRFAYIIDGVAERADLVILDAPALLLVGDASAVSASADGLVFVVNPMVVRRPQLQRSADQLAQLPCRKLGLVVVQSRHVEARYQYRGYYRRHSSGKAVEHGARAPEHGARTPGHTAAAPKAPRDA